ncbi:hypothetical protein BO71DRAFT_487349 [Aspergillus ellipticus CBS 707.79]|uniref:Major facilitator superfamily (MFS) profile domain-containing protein n=1 Tax=Aspergillus ellipticus CBS 707.79 TaxID=1448320 RepID=A0A319CY53_9EURO|nr:hypothetical protein BO71DRAFT_487349 [Aspergillus ellipticus CBS 707.79]
MSGLLTGTAFTQTFPAIDTTSTGHGSSSLQGTVVAIYEIGCFFGAIIALLVGERIGRRMCIIAGCIVLSIGAALQYKGRDLHLPGGGNNPGEHREHRLPDLHLFRRYFNFCFLPLIYLFYPETRNLTLEQVDRLFTGEKVQLHWHASMGAVGDASERVNEKIRGSVEHVEVEVE